MALYDLPLDELERYLPPLTAPSDFDAFWRTTLDDAEARTWDPRFEPFDAGLATIEAFDVTFAGFAGQPVRGWLLLPRHRDGPLPGMVEFIGYGGGRGFPVDWLLWPSAGYATLVMDTRGQGSAWLEGATDDPNVTGPSANGRNAAGPHHPGFMTAGILDPESYYYRRLYTDAVRALATLRAHPAVDARRVGATGRSQGGGVTLALAGLVPDLPLALPDVPFLCHFERAATVTDAAPYAEIAAYCKVHRTKVDTVFATLAYFDGMNFAARASARALFSAGLMDPISPPSTVFAAFNHYAGPKTMRLYRFNEHEGGETHHVLEQLRFVREAAGPG
jgi:cephalosporin-C deacetylase